MMEHFYIDYSYAKTSKIFEVWKTFRSTTSTKAAIDKLVARFYEENEAVEYVNWRNKKVNFSAAHSETGFATLGSSVTIKKYNLHDYIDARDNAGIVKRSK